MKKVIPFTSKAETDRLASAAAVAGREALAGAAPRFNDGLEQQLLLMQRLIGCNDPGTVLTRFFSWCSDLGLSDGMSYTPADDSETTLYGSRRHHSASYQLTLDNTQLGTLAVSRRERFSEDELMTLEQALGTLARVLRSAFEFQELQSLVSRDPLTGLGNRGSLQEWMEREMARARRQNSPLSLMMIDVDHFKAINDVLGHLAGDHVLCTLAALLKRSTRKSDLVFRFGGDEFTILLPHTDLEGAQAAARLIRENIARLSNADFGIAADQAVLRPDVSIGVASYRSGDDQESLMRRADTHLYSAKAGGRGAVCASL